MLAPILPFRAAWCLCRGVHRAAAPLTAKNRHRKDTQQTMKIQGYNFFCDMPDDMLYLRKESPDERFIEENMVFILPDRLRKFRKNLWHVRKNAGPTHIYIPLFRVKTILASDPVPSGYEGPLDVFPFYAHTSKRRSRSLDYYLLFVFRDKASYVKCKLLLNATNR